MMVRGSDERSPDMKFFPLRTCNIKFEQIKSPKDKLATVSVTAAPRVHLKIFLGATSFVVLEHVTCM